MTIRSAHDNHDRKRSEELLLHARDIHREGQGILEAGKRFRAKRYFLDAARMYEESAEADPVLADVPQKYDYAADAYISAGRHASAVRVYRRQLKIYSKLLESAHIMRDQESMDEYGAFKILAQVTVKGNGLIQRIKRKLAGAPAAMQVD